jgi:hypothetical protein
MAMGRSGWQGAGRCASGAEHTAREGALRGVLWWLPLLCRLAGGDKKEPLCSGSDGAGPSSGGASGDGSTGSGGGVSGSGSGSSGGFAGDVSEVQQAWRAFLLQLRPFELLAPAFAVVRTEDNIMSHLPRALFTAVTMLALTLPADFREVVRSGGAAEAVTPAVVRALLPHIAPRCSGFLPPYAEAVEAAAVLLERWRAGEEGAAELEQLRRSAWFGQYSVPAAFWQVSPSLA